MANSMNLLPNAIKANAIFSTICGLILLLFPRSIASFMEIENTLVFRIIGIGLFLFVLSLLNTLRKNPIEKRDVITIIVQDWIWVVASILLVIMNPFSISATGILLILGIAILVMTFAILQTKGLQQL